MATAAEANTHKTQTDLEPQSKLSPSFPPLQPNQGQKADADKNYPTLPTNYKDKDYNSGDWNSSESPCAATAEYKG